MTLMFFTTSLSLKRKLYIENNIDQTSFLENT